MLVLSLGAGAAAAYIDGDYFKSSLIAGDSNIDNFSREGRFLLRRMDEMSRMPEPTKEDSSFKRKLSKREKKQLKKQEKINKLKDKENAAAGGSSKVAGGGAVGGPDGGGGDERVGEKLYTGKVKTLVDVRFCSE